MNVFITCSRGAGGWLVPVLSVIAVAGCTKSVSLKVDAQVPIPVVAQIPVDVGVLYDPQFRDHVYTENTDDRPDWRIESGDSQVALFNQLLPPMFRSVKEVAALPVSGEGVQAVLAPQIEDIQFALPYETKSDLYEVWIKYNIRLFDPDGKLIASWPVSGYGKSSEELLKSKDEGLNSAMNLALRDAGAKLALGFDKVADVRTWLAETTRDCVTYSEVCGNASR
jgi:hypothetical protein